MKTFDDIQYERLNCAEVSAITEILLMKRLLKVKITTPVIRILIKLFEMYYPTSKNLLYNFIMCAIIIITCIAYGVKYIYDTFDGMMSFGLFTFLIVFSSVVTICCLYSVLIKLFANQLKKWFATVEYVLKIYFGSATANELFVVNSDCSISPTFNINDEFIKEISEDYPYDKSYHRRFLRYMYEVFSHINDAIDINKILAETRREVK